MDVSHLLVPDARLKPDLETEEELEAGLRALREESRGYQGQQQAGGGDARRTASPAKGGGGGAAPPAHGEEGGGGEDEEGGGKTYSQLVKPQLNSAKSAFTFGGTEDWDSAVTLSESIDKKENICLSIPQGLWKEEGGLNSPKPFRLAPSPF